MSNSELFELQESFNNSISLLEPLFTDIMLADYFTDTINLIPFKSLSKTALDKIIEKYNAPEKLTLDDISSFTVSDIIKLEGISMQFNHEYNEMLKNRGTAKKPRRPKHR